MFLKVWLIESGATGTAATSSDAAAAVERCFL